MFIIEGKNFQFNSVDVNTSSKFKLNNNEQSQILESKLVTDLNSNNSSCKFYNFVI